MDTLEKVNNVNAAVGALVSGGIGEVGNPPKDGTLGTVGNDASDLGAGILRPEQSRQFIEYLWDNTVLAQDGRRVVMRANTFELEKMHVGERLIRAANQADGTYTNADVSFTKIELRTTKIRLDWEVATESLEDNIEGAGLEDHLVRTMTGQFAVDLEDLAINGDGTTGSFLSILEGFVVKEQEGNEATGLSGDWTIEDFQKVVTAMPRKFRAIRSNLKFYLGTDTLNTALNSLGQNGSGATVERIVGDVIEGRVPQVVGAPVQYRFLGIPAQEVPLYPENYVSLTFPNNRIWGFQRDVTVHSEFKPKKDTVEYTVFVRFGVQVEETDAIAWAETSEGAGS